MPEFENWFQYQRYMCEVEIGTPLNTEIIPVTDIFVEVQRANDYYLRAIRADPTNSYSLFRYGQFLEKCQMLEHAEDYYLLSLEVPSFVVPVCVCVCAR
jgi:hypothetical protein